MSVNALLLDAKIEGGNAETKTVAVHHTPQPRRDIRTDGAFLLLDGREHRFLYLERFAVAAHDINVRTVTRVHLYFYFTYTLILFFREGWLYFFTVM
jgi:hypothetical protein